jgi:hypothetical protein
VSSELAWSFHFVQTRKLGIRYINIEIWAQCWFILSKRCPRHWHAGPWCQSKPRRHEEHGVKLKHTKPQTSASRVLTPMSRLRPFFARFDVVEAPKHTTSIAITQCWTSMYLDAEPRWPLNNSVWALPLACNDSTLKFKAHIWWCHAEPHQPNPKTKWLGPILGAKDLNAKLLNLGVCRLNAEPPLPYFLCHPMWYCYS